MTDHQMKQVVFWLAAATALVMLMGGCLSLYLADYTASIMALLIAFGLVWVMYFCATDKKL